MKLFASITITVVFFYLVYLGFSIVLVPQVEKHDFETKQTACDQMHKEFCFVVQGCTDMYQDTETCEMNLRTRNTVCMNNKIEDIWACKEFLSHLTCDSEIASNDDPCTKIQ